MPDSNVNAGKVVRWSAKTIEKPQQKPEGPGVIAELLKHLTPLEAESAREEGWSGVMARVKGLEQR